MGAVIASDSYSSRNIGTVIASVSYSHYVLKFGKVVAPLTSGQVDLLHLVRWTCSTLHLYSSEYVVWRSADKVVR